MSVDSRRTRALSFLGLEQRGGGEDDELGSGGPGIAADTEGLAGSEVEAWNSGGTAGALPAERAQASFTVEKMVRALPPVLAHPHPPPALAASPAHSQRARGRR